jgi:CheY-like chemotaxis protein
LLFAPSFYKLASMTMKPLTLLLYEKLLPGGQLLGRLEDMGYRVQSLTEPAELVAVAEREKPMLIIADFEPQLDAVAKAVAALKRGAATAHIPVIGLVSARNAAAQSAARQAAANLVVQDTVILQHLPQFIDQALAFD